MVSSSCGLRSTPLLLSLGAAAAAFLIWLVSADDEEEAYPASELCELCCENAEDFEDDKGPHGMCFECGRMFCCVCRRKMIVTSEERRAAAGLPRVAEIPCPFCRSNTEGSAPTYLMLRKLLETRPKSRCIKHCHFQMGLVRSMGFGVGQSDAIALAHFRDAAALGHGQAMYWIGGSYEDGVGVEKDEAEAMRWYRRGRAAGDPNATGCADSESTRMLNRMAREQNRVCVAERRWQQTPPDLAERGFVVY